MVLHWALLVAMALVAVVASQRITQQTCDRRQRFGTVRGDADVLLAGVFPIRTSGQDEYGCGDVGTEMYRITAYEAARYAVERINDVNFIPGVTLGLKAYDSCSSPHVAVAGMDEFFQESRGWQCQANASQLALGAIGGYFSDVTAEMAKYLGYSSIPQVAYASNDAKLSDKLVYPNLVRTGAPVSELVEAMLMTLVNLKWTRIGVIYVDDELGRNVASLLKKNGGIVGICVAEQARVAHDNANQDSLNSELRRLVNSNVRAIVLAVAEPEVSQVLQVLDSILPGDSDLQIISPYQISGNSRLLPGTISVFRQESAVEEFIGHLARIDPQRPPPANPWFQEWYMGRFRCRLPGNANPQFSFLRLCNQLNEAQRRDAYTADLDHSVYREAIQSVYAFAAALQKARSDRCRGRPSGPCPELSNMSHENFLKNYLRSLNYRMTAGDGIPGIAGSVIAFDGNGDNRESHSFAIYNYNRRQGQLSHKQVGTFSRGRLELDRSKIEVYDRAGFRPLSAVPQLGCSRNQCRQCLTSGHLQYWYTPGDVIIVGLTSLHDAGSDPATCGTLVATNSFRAIAFQQSVAAQNADNSPLRVGSLLVDVCRSEARVTDFLNRFYSGGLQLRDGSNKVIDSNRVVGTVDMLEDNMAKTVAQYSTLIKTPVVGTVAADKSLSDHTAYPYYSQRVPTDDKEAEAITNFLQAMNWTFVQVIHSGDTYGRSKVTAFTKAADAASVCIAQSLEIGVDGDASEILSKLRQIAGVKVTVVFGRADATEPVLLLIGATSAKGDFVVITTESEEGTSNQVFPSQEGSFFKVRMSDAANLEYERYLRQLNPQRTENRFVIELYQRTFQCQVGSLNQPCNSSQSLTDSSLYGDTAKAASQAVTRAVTLMGNNVKKAYNEICQNCGSALDTIKLRQRLQENLATEEAKTKEGVIQILGYKIKPGENFTKIAEYSHRSFRMEPILPSWNIQKNAYSCQGFCGQCSYLVNRHPHIYKEGDVMLGALIGIMGTNGNPFACDNQKLENGYQHAVAVLYALRQVNSGEAPVSLNNVTLGSLVLDDCNSDQRALGLVNEIYAGANPLQGDLYVDMAPFRGWLSHSQSDVFNVASNLQSFGTPVVASEASSIGETEISRSRMMYSTAAIFNQKAMTIIRMVKSRGYKYFQALYSSEAGGSEKLDILRKVAAEEGLCLVKAVKLSDDATLNLRMLTGDLAKAVVVIADSLRYAERLQKASSAVSASDGLLFFTIEPMRFNNKPIAKNVLSVRQQVSELRDFRKFLSTRSLESDGFYSFYYQSVFQCDLAGSTKYNKSCAVEVNRSLPEDSTVQNTIHGVYALAAAVHKTLQDKCGVDYNGRCAEFRASRDTNQQISQNLAQVSFNTPGGGKFGFTGRWVNQNFDIVIEEPGRSVKVGSDYNGRLVISRSDLLDRFSTIKSTCNQPCLTCTPQGFFDHIPGDVYIAGIFNIHYKSVEPFRCGRIKTIFGYQSIEAFKYALDKVNRKHGQFRDILKGVTLGGLGLDSCDSAVRTTYLAANIHNGETVISKNGTDISPADIIGYVAARESDQSRFLARVLKSLDVPQISYGSTSIELTDQFRYPMFARTVPIDDEQSDAILAFLDSYDLRYVQVLRSPTSYGELSSQAFLEKAAAKRVCVSHTVTFRDKGVVTKESATEAVANLLENPTSNVVIVFADIGYINEFLRGIKRTPDARGKFLFIGTVSWNRNEVLLEGVEDVAYGSVIINVEKVDIPLFDRYLEKKTLISERDNTWFKEYYEAIHNCLVTASEETRIGGKAQCDIRHQNIVTSGNYLQDPDILHVTNAVYAAAFGVDYALRELCGQNYTGMCRQFRESDSRRRELMFEGALKARFQDEAFANFRFTKKRSGNKGYTLYSIEPTSASATYNYKDIGKYSGTTLDIRDFQTSWNGSCDRQDTCNECPGIRDQTTRLHMWPDPNRAGSSWKGVVPKIVAVFDVHQAQESDEFRCGGMNHKSVFDNVLAFIYTLDKLVNPVKPGFEIGGVILDTCSRSVKLYPDLLGLIRGNGYCNTWLRQGSGVDLANIMGIISHGEDNALVVNRILTPMAVTSVSPNAVSPVLSDFEKYPYFLRTKPPYDLEGEAILDVLRSQGWTYISLVYSDDARGRTISNYMLRNAMGDGSLEQAVCIGTILVLRDNDEQSVANGHVTTLDEQGKRGARVVVWLTSPKHSEMMLEGIRAMRPDTKLVTIGLHTWGLGDESFSALGEYLVNGITLKTYSPQIPEFLKYKAALGYADANRHGLPDDWFDEFYQHAHACHLINTSVSQSHLYKSRCDKTERLNLASLRHDPDVFHTIISTYTMATGLNKIFQTCGDLSFEQCARENANLRSEIYQQVWDTKWPEIMDTLQISRAELTSYQYEYLPGRYGNTGYLLYSVDKVPDTGEPFLQKIGRWNGTIQFDQDGNYTGVDGLVVESRCLSCRCRFLGGETAPATGEDKWGSIVRTPRNYYVLEETVNAEGAKSYRRVIEWPVWAVVICILTCIMILITLIVFVLLLFLYQIRSGTTVLGFMLLLGILGIFLVNFAFFIPASAASCGARRFLMGVVYAICFAALLVKAVDNWRYTWHDYSIGKRKYKGVASACSLLLVALTLVAIQILIGILWLVITAPGATLVRVTTPPHDYWWCNPPLLYDVGLVLSFMFVILLILATIIFATISFLKDINHFESRWLLASCLCTGAIFVAWMIISTMATAPYRDATVAIANLLNGTILLILFPLRKLWLLYQIYTGKYETKGRNSVLNMSATEHMEMNERKRALERDRAMAAHRATLAERSMDQSFMRSSGNQSGIYSQPKNAYAASTLNRSAVTESAVAGNLRHHESGSFGHQEAGNLRHHESGSFRQQETGHLRHQAAAAPSLVDMRKEQRTTTVIHKSTEERIDQNGVSAARVGRKNEDPEPVIITELVDKPVERRPDDQFILTSRKPHVYETDVRTTRVYREDIPDTIPPDLSASYEVDEVSFDPNTQSQRTERHRHETITTEEPIMLPIRLEGPPSKSRSSSSASSFSSSRLDRPFGRPLESDLVMSQPLMELDGESPVLSSFGGPSDGKVDRQTKKTTVVETGDDGTTKKTTTVEETSYFEY